MKVLIVEDQTYPLKFLESAVKKIVPKYFEDFGYDVVRCFDDAKERISNSDYGLVLLDNRIPRKDLEDLEGIDFDAFSESLENIGYTLINTIKGRNFGTAIIGTSSMPESTLRNHPSRIIL